jgi:hypothetical protein
MEGKAVRLLLSFALVTSSIYAFAQQSSLSETDQLRAQLEIQQRIEALESALAEQQKTLVKLGLVDKPESSAAVEHPATYRETPTYEVESQNNAAPSQEKPWASAIPRFKGGVRTEMGTRDREARLAVVETAHAPAAELSYVQA